MSSEYLKDNAGTFWPRLTFPEDPKKKETKEMNNHVIQEYLSAALAEYIDTMNRYGPRSDESRSLRDKHSQRKNLIALIDSATEVACSIETGTTLYGQRPKPVPSPLSTLETWDYYDYVDFANDILSHLYDMLDAVRNGGDVCYLRQETSLKIMEFAESELFNSVDLYSFLDHHGRSLKDLCDVDG